MVLSIDQFDLSDLSEMKGLASWWRNEKWILMKMQGICSDFASPEGN
jgi:hypothetical protein